MGLWSWLFGSPRIDPVSRSAATARNKRRDSGANDAFAFGSCPYTGAGADIGAFSSHGSSGFDGGGSCDSGGGGGCGGGDG